MPSKLDHVQELWTCQQQEPFDMSLDAIHARATRFQSRIRVRNLVEYGAAVLVIGVLGYTAYVSPLAVKAACALEIAGLMFVCWRLYTLGRAASRDEMAHAKSWAAFHRGELVRQHAALSSVWRWYLGPMIPGIVAFFAATAFSIPDAPLLARLGVFTLGAAFVGAVFLAVGAINAKAARALQREIDKLDSARRE